MRTDLRWDRPAGRRHGRPHRERRCGKIRYRDKREAVDFLHFAGNARQVVALDGELGATTALRVCRAYFCPVCQGYHVTSQAEPVARL